MSLTGPLFGYSPPVQNGYSELNSKIFGADDYLLPHYRTFGGIYNEVTRMYSFRFDECMKHAPSNAQAMRNDAYFSALLQERVTPLTRWEWQIELDADDAKIKDSKDKEREEIRGILESIVRNTWGFPHMRSNLSEFPWAGKAGQQILWGDTTIGGFKRKAIVHHRPVHEDKIMTDFDGCPAIAIYGGDLARYPQRAIGWGGDPSKPVPSGFQSQSGAVYGDRFPVLKLDRPDYRQQFIIPIFHMRDGDYFDPYSAGRVGGVGLRHYSYWAWWLRDEMLAWATDFMEKVGSLGIMIFYYQESSVQGKQRAEAAARKVGNGNALSMPVPAGDPRVGSVDAIPANMTGVQFLKDFIGKYFEGHIERLFVGQKLSAGTEGGGLGGAGVANLHMNTKYHLLASDAELMSWAFTEDLVKPAMRMNFPKVPWKYHFKLIVPDPTGKDKLEAVSKAFSMGVDFGEDDVRALTGMPKPDEGVRTLKQIKQEEAQQQAQMQNQQTALKHPTSMKYAPELVGAMLQSADSPEAVNALAGLANDPDQMEQIVGDGQQEPTQEPEQPNDAEKVQYSWTAGSTASGGVKAIGTGEHEGRTLYGAKAEAALRNQDKGPKQDDAEDGTVQQRLNQTNEEGDRFSKGTPRATVTSVLRKLDEATPDDIAEFARALPKLSMPELKEMTKYYEGGWRDKAKQDIVGRLVQWAKSNRENAELRKGKQAEVGNEAAPNGGHNAGPEEEPQKPKSETPAEPKAETPNHDVPPGGPAPSQPQKPDPDYTQGDEWQPEIAHPVYDKLLSGLKDAKPGLSKEQTDHYRKSMGKVLGAMPKAALDKLHASNHSFNFHGTTDEIGNAALESAYGMPGANKAKLQAYKEKFDSGELKPGAAYSVRTGKVHLDGDLNGNYPAHEVYAHILGHALNGPDKAVSKSPEWQDAWQSEVKGLNKYAGKNPSEGMAEFSRLVYGGKMSPEDIQSKFPKASAAFAKHGLMDGHVRTDRTSNETPQENKDLPDASADASTLPVSLPTGTTTAPIYGSPDENGVAPLKVGELGGTAQTVLPDIFSERVDLDADPEGDHVDAMAEKPGYAGVSGDTPEATKQPEMSPAHRELRDQLAALRGMRPTKKNRKAISELKRKLAAFEKPEEFDKREAEDEENDRLNAEAKLPKFTAEDLPGRIKELTDWHNKQEHAAREKKIAALQNKIQKANYASSIRKHASGRLDPDDSALKAHYSGRKEAIEDGIPAHIFAKRGTRGAQGLDGLAQSMETEGHFVTPEGKHATQHLLDLIKSNARSASYDTGETDALRDELYQLEHQHALSQASADDVEAAVRSGEAQGVSQAQEGQPTAHEDEDDTDHYEDLGEEVGDTSFDFGANADGNGDTGTDHEIDGTSDGGGGSGDVADDTDKSGNGVRGEDGEADVGEHGDSVEGGASKASDADDTDDRAGGSEDERGGRAVTGLFGDTTRVFRTKGGQQLDLDDQLRETRDEREGREIETPSELPKGWEKAKEGNEEAEHHPDHIAIGKRFGIPPQAVKDILETHPDELAKRSSYNPPSSSREYAVGPTTDYPKHPIGSARIDDSRHKNGETDEAYVDYLREFDPHSLKLSEHEDGMRKSGSVDAYRQWLRDGHSAPPISVFDSNNGNGDLVSSNRRRVLAAQMENAPKIQGWHGVLNKETGNPLKFGDIHRAAKELREKSDEPLDFAMHDVPTEPKGRAAEPVDDLAGITVHAQNALAKDKRDHRAAMNAIPVGEEGEVAGRKLINNGNGVFSGDHEGKRFIGTAEDWHKRLGDGEAEKEPDKVEAKTPEEPKAMESGPKPWEMSKKDFYKKYQHQHSLLRGDDEATKKALETEGFKRGIGPNTVGITQHRNPTDVVSKRYGTLEGNHVYAIPKDAIRKGGNGDSVKDGHKPHPNEGVRIKSDYEPVHEAMVRAAIERGETVPPKVLAEYPHLATLDTSAQTATAAEPEKTKSASSSPHTKATKDEHNHRDFSNSHEYWTTQGVPEGHVRVTLKEPEKGAKAYLAKLTGYGNRQYHFERDWVNKPRVKAGGKYGHDLAEGVYEARTANSAGHTVTHYFKIEDGKLKTLPKDQVQFHLPAKPKEPKSDIDESAIPYANLVA